jgi:16S rRNA (guanine527-N7)-methyltransferase
LSVSRETVRRLLDALAAEPDPHTTVSDPKAARDVHVADSLSGLEVRELASARRIADIGAGAGFPGLVLAIALPRAQVDLVESVGRKTAVIGRLIRAAELSNARSITTRVEDFARVPEALGGGREAYDAVTARAVGSLPVLVEYAAPLLREGGTLVAWKGRRGSVEEADGAAAASATGLTPTAVEPVRPWPEAEHRHLHLYLKVGLTPNRYPRRPGRASKRPLRAST